jgi:hypothetical protein
VEEEDSSVFLETSTAASSLVSLSAYVPAYWSNA